MWSFGGGGICVGLFFLSQMWIFIFSLRAVSLNTYTTYIFRVWQEGDFSSSKPIASQLLT